MYDVLYALNVEPVQFLGTGVSLYSTISGYAIIYMVLRVKENRYGYRDAEGP